MYQWLFLHILVLLFHENLLIQKLIKAKIETGIHSHALVFPMQIKALAWYVWFPDIETQFVLWALEPKYISSVTCHSTQENNYHEH